MTLLLIFLCSCELATFHKETMLRLLLFSETLPASAWRNEQRDSLWDKMSSDRPSAKRRNANVGYDPKQQFYGKGALDFRNLKVFSAPSRRFGGEGGDFQPGHAGARCLGGFSSLSAAVISENGRTAMSSWD